MCGICGFVGTGLEREHSERILVPMIQSLAHRGPDGQGSRVFVPPAVPRSIALGHTRLAIIDLSPAAQQPMRNEDGTAWIVFNGEIYNFQELRSDLRARGHVFQSSSDTETIVHLYEELGSACVERLIGIFAFAIVDLRKRQLLLARDPIGVKPLYYSLQSNLLVFGSEIKAILASGFCPVKVNWQAIYDYFTYLYVPCPETAFGGIWQLPPAHRLILNLEDGASRLERYWQVRPREDTDKASFCDLNTAVRDLLTDAVRRQLISDVPLGVFLSGGIDSTIVAGLAKKADPSLQTFTAVFQGKEFSFYNEQDLARETSRHLGTEHHELQVPVMEPMEISNLVEFFDQPFGNPTFYLMYLLSKHAREHIQVALCGAGGDELYAGYPRYRAVQLARRLQWVPRPLLRLGMPVLGLVRDSYRTMSVRRARKFLDGLDSDLVSQFVKWTYYFNEQNKAELIVRGSEGRGWADGMAPSDRFVRSAIGQSRLPDPDNRLLHADVETFLVNNLLEYTDKMSMAVGLETRVPLLDHRFVELSLNVPFAHKLRNGKSKLLLREAFAEFFPPAARKAPKRGFNAPLPHWMRQVFDEYFTASTLSRHAMKDMLGPDLGASWKEGILDWTVIERLRIQQREGKRDNSYELFAVIVFDVWWRKYVKGSLPMSHWKTASLSQCAY